MQKSVPAEVQRSGCLIVTDLHWTLSSVFFHGALRSQKPQGTYLPVRPGSPAAGRPHQLHTTPELSKWTLSCFGVYHSPWTSQRHVPSSDRPGGHFAVITVQPFVLHTQLFRVSGPEPVRGRSEAVEVCFSAGGLDPYD